MESNSQIVKSLLGRAKCANDSGDFESAFKHTNKVLQSYDPSNYDAYNLKGKAYAGSKKLDEALKCFETAIQIDPYNYRAYRNKAAALYKAQKYESCLYHIDIFSELNPEYDDSHFLRALVLERLGKPNEALQSAKQATVHSPQQEKEGSWLCYANILLNMDNFNEAIGGYNEAIGINPRCKEAYLGRSLAFSAINNIKEALKDLNEIITSIDPYDIEAYEIKINILETAGRNAEAGECWKMMQKCIRDMGNNQRER